MREQCLRYDDGKVRLDLIPARFLFELGKVYSYGATKYSPNQWRNATSWSRCFGAMMRHAWKWAAGEDVDPESGCLHLAMAAFWCAALIEWRVTHIEFDDREKSGWV